MSESILALENYLFLKLLDIDTHSFDYLVNNSNYIFIEHRKGLASAISKAPNAFEASEIFEDEKDVLSFFIDYQYEIKSVPRKLLKYINDFKFGEITFAPMQKTVVESAVSHEVVASPSLLPSKEVYENEINTTKYQRFVDAVDKYKFYELEKVKLLDDTKKSKLIHLIINNPVAYSVVMLKHIGYFDKLRDEYEKNRDSSFNHVAEALGTAPRTVKGNFNVLNPESKEDSLKYNSSSYVDKVKTDYDNL